MRVDVSGHLFSFPRACACCGAVPDSTLTVSASRSRGSRVVRTEGRSWDFPYCTRCIKHVQRAGTMRMLVRQFIALSVLLGVIVGFSESAYLGFGIGILCVVATVAVGFKLHNLARGPGCVDADSSIAYLGWSGTLHQFEIASRRFAFDFMVANRRKLVNLSAEAISLLSAEGADRAPIGSQSPRRYIR
jgi:ribosomal protein L28